MANKQMASLSINNRYFKETSALWEEAYKSLLEAVGNFAADNPETDITALGAITMTISDRLRVRMEKAEALRARY